MIELPALSIRQPWAWSIVHAGKDIENRSWPTRFRGRVLIHAGLCFDGDADDEFLTLTMQSAALVGGAPVSKIPEASRLPKGGIVGIAEIVDCITHSDSPWFFGPYGFVLENVRPLPFHPCKGRLGFFPVQYPGEVAA